MDSDKSFDISGPISPWNINAIITSWNRVVIASVKPFPVLLVPAEPSNVFDELSSEYTLNLTWWPPLAIAKLSGSNSPVYFESLPFNPVILILSTSLLAQFEPSLSLPIIKP